MKNIKSIVNHYIKKFETRDPFELAKCLNIELQIGPLGSQYGCYMFLKNHRYIFLNDSLGEQKMRMVMAHELAHAILHRKENSYFIKNKTLLLNSKNEIEANTFAAELLISDDFMIENQEYTVDQIARMTGYSEELIRLKIKGYGWDS